MKKLLFFFVIFFTLPALAYAHGGGHPSKIMRLKHWWAVIWFQYWETASWLLVFILIGLVIFFIIQQMKNRQA